MARQLWVAILASLVTGITIGSIAGPDGFEPASAVLSAVLVFVGLIAVSLADARLRKRQLAFLASLIGRVREMVRGERDELLGPAEVTEPDLENLARQFGSVADEIVRQRDLVSQQRQEIREILNGIGEGLLAIDRARHIKLANDRLCEIFGVERPLIGRPFVEIVRHTALVSAFERALQGTTSTERATVFVRGTERQIEIRCFPLERSPEIAAVALFIDVSQIQRLERIRRDFIADFSHEVRTPLAGLRSAVETLERAEELSTEHQEQLLRVLGRQAGRLERLVQDLAELNSIESGEVVLHREPTPLLRLLEELVEDFTRSGERDDLRIVVEGAEVLADVDPARMEQIASNLIDNALRHAPGSGIRVTVGREGSEAVVRIHDTGPGIPPGELDRIFHRFYRIDKSRSDSGTGLGLAITRHLVLGHGGSIRVASDSRSGTTFTVRMPCAPQGT